MKFTCTAIVALAIAASGYALFTPRDDATAPCSGARVVSASQVVVGSKTVAVETLACDAKARTLSTLDTTPTTDPPVVDVCGGICTDVCGNLGTLPPTTDDCQTIVDAITILNGSVSPSFTVAPGHAQTLAFGTCRFFFQNFSPTVTMSECWLTLAQQASAAGAACLPPVQPINSEGVCISTDSLWRVGVAHS